MTLLTERRELLERFRRGERRALEEVYRHYVSDVAQFLSRGFTFQSRDKTLRFVGYAQPFDLDNALQETFARAFKERARIGYDGINRYRNYLFAIARNFVIDEMRSREIAMSPMFAEVADDAVHHDGEEAHAAGTTGSGAPGGSQEQTLLSDELARLYSGFVARLDERDRSFFQARFEQQKTQVEAGQVCQLSHMQARTLEKKLRERFLVYMQENGYLEAYRSAVSQPAAVGDAK
jgi:RNA polymerase sigma factor (sigma-70 family)